MSVYEPEFTWIFQFLLVRLIAFFDLHRCPVSDISIPFGSINSTHVNEEIHCPYISIPFGSINSFFNEETETYTDISIPFGSINR